MARTKATSDAPTSAVPPPILRSATLIELGFSPLRRAFNGMSGPQAFRTALLGRLVAGVASDFTQGGVAV
jgi:hypothetical protein